MGDFLTKPITEKHPVDEKNDRLMYGACSMQGWRKTNEDAHIHKLDIGDGNSLFAVFDGHGGEQVALFCEKYFIDILINNEEYRAKNYAKALEETFVEIDYLLLSDEGLEKMKQIYIELKQQTPGLRGITSKLEISEEKELRAIPFNAGCTSCVCLITQDAVYCSNAGDSRAILVNKAGKVTELSKDHKPDNDGEMKRIKAGGGFVDDGRVQGIIAVSRAIGDWEYKNPSLLAQLEKKIIPKKKRPINEKNQLADEGKSKGGPYRNIEEGKKHQVTSFPDITKVQLQPDADFIIIACDGIWDCFTNEQAAQFVRDKRAKGPKQGFLTSPSKIKSAKSFTSAGSKSTAASNSQLAMKKRQSEPAKNKTKGETTFIIEEMMDQGIAKGDITMSDGTGTDNMTCIIIFFRDPDEVKTDNQEQQT